MRSVAQLIIHNSSLTIYSSIFVNHCKVKDKRAERNEKYKAYVKSISPKSRMWPSLIWAFLVGGLICVMGHGLYLFFEWLTPYSAAGVSALVAVTLIGLAAILTGFGIYDKIGKFAGGGSIVPITGFSNAATAAAMEHRKEGIVFGTMTNLFKIVGPVLVTGVALSMLVGFIYWIISLF